MKRIIVCIVAAVLTGCDWGTEGSEGAQRAALAWADAYFSCDYHAAEQHVTPESAKWLRFAASNTTEGDLQLLQEHDIRIDVEDSYAAGADTLCVVTLQVSHYLAATPLGSDAAIGEDGRFQVFTVLRDGRWLVRMEGLPRSEKQSRD